MASSMDRGATMSRDKKHRHDNDHDQRADRPQSTDIADVIEADDSSAKASKHQRTATAGPSEDDRFGAGAHARDAEGRIIAVNVVGDGTQIMIALGSEQGVGVGMDGYIKTEDGMLADFQIHKVTERVSYAIVDVTPDGIGGHLQVVVNPSSLPKKSQPQKNMEARIIAVNIEGDRTKIRIARGVRNGARAGMRGYVVGSNGRPLEDFEVVEQYSGTCVAFVNLTVDQVQSHLQVVLNPS